MIQGKVQEEFKNVIDLFKKNNLDNLIALSFIDTNFDFLQENKTDIDKTLFLIMNKNELYSVLFVKDNNYLWSTYIDEKFLSFKEPTKKFEDNDSIVERVLSYAKSDKVQEAIPEIDSMNIENKVKVLKKIGLNSNGYHIK